MFLALVLTASVPLSDFGGYPDDWIDDTQAFVDALASFDSNRYRGGHLTLECGQYDLSDTIVIEQSVRISGESTGPNHPCTLLKFPPSVPGIYVGGDVYTHNDNGNGTILEFIELDGHYGADTAHGIWLEVDTSIRDVVVRRFGGDCIHVSADVNRTPASNANLFDVRDSDMINCAGWGMWIDGGDTNAGMVTRSDFLANYSGQLYASSFIGNLFIGDHFNGNGDCGDSDPGTRCGVVATAGGGSSFIGNYAEGSTNLEINWPSSWKDGIGGGVMTGTGIFEKHGIYQGKPRQSWNLENRTEIRHGTVSQGAGYGIEEWDAIDGMGRVRDPMAIRLGYEPNGAYTLRGWWCRYFNNAGGSSYLCHATDKVEGTAEKRGQLWFRGGEYWLGAGEYMPHKRVWTGLVEEKPTRTDLPAGSFARYYSEADAGTSTMGWLWNGVEWVAK